MSYTPIHLHSEYSLLDGGIQFPSLIEYLQELGIKNCAITDHGYLGGILEFYKECKEAGIKPLIGVEAYVTQDEDNLSEEQERTRDNYHIVLIAKDNEGLRRLSKLMTEASLNNFYYKPRIYIPKLTELTGHCVATTACLKGILTSHLDFTEDKYGRIGSFIDLETLESALKWYIEIFKGDFYLEIQDWSDETNIQPAYNEFILKLSKRHNLPLVISSDCHYLKKEDHQLHEVLMAMQLKKTLEEYRSEDVMKYGPHFYVKTPEEMRESCKKWNCPEAYDNTNEIAEKCNVEIEIGKYESPEVDITEMEDYEEFLKWTK